LWKAVQSADPTNYVRGQYDGYLNIDGVATGSTTETYAALRLDIENWRWDGVPIFLRTGKRMPVTQTELRLIFHKAPKLGLKLPGFQMPNPSELVVRLDPSVGIRMRVAAHRGYTQGPVMADLDVEFDAEQATPYEVLLHAALIGNPTRFTRQDGVEEEWRIVQPLLNNPPPVHAYKPDTWGPAAADQLVAEFGGWREPWDGAT
jgi:glucose-6-phosphate 1-dehydrogenase